MAAGAGETVIDYEYPEPVAGAGHDDRLADGAHLDRDLRDAGGQPLRRRRGRLRVDRLAARRGGRAGPARALLPGLARRGHGAGPRRARPPGRAARGSVRRVPVRRADPAHQPGGDPPRGRDLPPPRPVRPPDRRHSDDHAVPDLHRRRRPTPAQPVLGGGDGLRDRGSSRPGEADGGCRLRHRRRHDRDRRPLGVAHGRGEP